MPRDGSDVYHLPPGTDGAPDTTIESAKYNSFIADVEQDLNTPRPIVAGGTGGTNPDDALLSLSAEKASQVVSNFDSHIWLPGSFNSASSATGAPVAGHAFSGIVYMADSSNIVVEARDSTDGLLYVRRKVAGVWGGWVLQGDLSGVNADIDAVEASVAALNTAKVNRSGDTISGNLVVTGNTNTGTLNAGATVTTTLAASGKVDCNAGSVGDINSAGGSGAFEVKGAGAGNHAFMSFHRPSAHAINFGLADDGNLWYGGWSAGAGVKYRVITTKEFTPNPQMFAGIPINNSSNYTTVATDAEKCIAGTGTITINSALYPVGTCITFAGYGGAMTIACSGNTLYWIGPSGLTSGNRSLPDRGIATAIRTPDGHWIIGGNGLT